MRLHNSLGPAQLQAIRTDAIHELLVCAERRGDPDTAQQIAGLIRLVDDRISQHETARLQNRMRVAIGRDPIVPGRFGRTVG